MNLRLSCDDGCASDIKVADLASKYEVPCTFYWPVNWHSLAFDNGYRPLDFYEASLISDNHEIGSHTITHRHLTKISKGEAESEIIESRFMLQNLFDISISKFCFPRGYSNPWLNTTAMRVYESYRLTKGFDSDGYKLVHVHPNSGANDNKPWRECVTTENIHLWFHSHELDRYDLWDELEDFLRSGV